MRQTVSSHKLRIIAGRWRGRRFSFPAIEGLRPTSDRIRETLFNWLAPVISGATCLDLFAGSGALGFEALSRDAKLVYMIDQAKPVVTHLKNIAASLKTEAAIIHQDTLPAALARLTQTFDIVFLDPPFHQNLLASCCEMLENSGRLAEQAYIYIEAEALLSSLPVPTSWQILHSKQAGQVGYHLLRRQVSH